MLGLDECTAHGELVPVNIFFRESRDSTFCIALIHRLQLAVRWHTLIAEVVGQNIRTRSNIFEIKLKTASGEIMTLHGSKIWSIAKPVAVSTGWNWEIAGLIWRTLSPINMCGGRINIFIVLDHATHVTPIEPKRDDEPTAFKPRSGLALQGAMRIWNEENANAATVHRVFTSTDAGQLVEQFWRFCYTESLGTEFQANGMLSTNRRAVVRLEAEMEKLPLGNAAHVQWKKEIPPDISEIRMVDTRLRSLNNWFPGSGIRELKSRCNAKIF